MVPRMWTVVGIGSVALIIAAIVMQRRSAVAASGSGASPYTPKDPLAELERKAAANASLAPLLAIARARDVAALHARVTAQRGEWDEVADELRALADAIPRQAYDDFVAKTPGPTSRLLRGAHGVAWAWTARGAGRGEDVNDVAADLFMRRLEDARADLEAATGDAGDPTPWSFLITVHLGLSSGRDVASDAFQNAVDLAPAHFAAHRAMLNFLNVKWYGESHDDALAFARTRRGVLGPNHPVGAFMVISAHFFRAEYLCQFESKREEGLAWLRFAEVKAELADLWDQALASADLGARREEVLSMTAAVLFLAEDKPRCRAALERLGTPLDFYAWYFTADSYAGGEQAFEAARAWCKS